MEIKKSKRQAWKKIIYDTSQQKQSVIFENAQWNKQFLVIFAAQYPEETLLEGYKFANLNYKLLLHCMGSAKKWFLRNIQQQCSALIHALLNSPGGRWTCWSGQRLCLSG